MTGRQRFTTEWLGATIQILVEENAVSRWADEHSKSGIYPGVYGWSLVGTANRRWFGRTSIGCGGYGVSPRNFRGEINLVRSSGEEVLRKYQTELIANWKQNSSLLLAIKDRARSAGSTNREASIEVR